MSIFPLLLSLILYIFTIVRFFTSETSKKHGGLPIFAPEMSLELRGPQHQVQRGAGHTDRETTFGGSRPGRRRGPAVGRKTRSVQERRNKKGIWITVAYILV